MNEQVAKARAFAIACHGDQKYGNHPYAVHLDAVVGLLEPFGETAQVIGYLHDAVEDTPVPLDVIRKEFGDQVAACVAWSRTSREAIAASGRRRPTRSWRRSLERTSSQWL